MKDLLPLLLKEVEQLMQQVKQWEHVRETGWAANYMEYICQLKALVELLEVADCGSTGGFGKGQGYADLRRSDWCNENHNPGDLFDRAKWLLRKYKTKPLNKKRGRS